MSRPRRLPAVSGATLAANGIKFLPDGHLPPLRLTPAEGCSLLLGIRALRESGIAPFDAAMQGAERKLLTALGRDAREAESLATSTVVAEPDAAVASHLRALVSATRSWRTRRSRGDP